ncbi:hypothetical protein SLEP1_g48583 [Rubroshorea leprosula]|uniref:Uncharacterized protein n=1 Tax=Rubroshorea leprosula TaxID=152421 RepID=A0AAV5LU19_9ROSI|nr:hypothetical protein SLEP1_g48583 [Rubroshorea leprosula]
MMSGLFRSKSCGQVGLTDGPFFHRRYSSNVEDNGGEEEEEEFNEEDDDDDIEGSEIMKKQIPTPFISPESSFGGEGRNGNSMSKSNHFTILDILVGGLRKSLVMCGVESGDVVSRVAMCRRWTSAG